MGATRSISGLRFDVGANGQPERIHIDLNKIGNDYKGLINEFIEDLYDSILMKEREGDERISEDEMNQFLNNLD